MPKPIIETYNLTKRFYPAKGIGQFLSIGREPVTVLNKVSVRVDKGEIFVIMGPNGAGKTVFIKILSALILPSEGSAMVNGYDVVREEMKVKSSIGLLTGDERSFYWRLTGRENLSFFASLFNLSRDKADKKIRELARLLEIKELDRRFNEYSAGTKQRIAIARCLLNDPEIIFMDEPTKDLDPSAAKNLRQFIKRDLVGRYGKTVLFSTHNLHEAGLLGDCLAIIDSGRVKAYGSIDRLKEASGLPAGTDMEGIYNYYVNK